MLSLAQSQQKSDLLEDLQHTRNLAEALMKTKHYQQLGVDGIFAVIQKAKSLNINPINALNGGLYYVQGRVEMSSQLMNQLIRSQGHSIQKDAKSTQHLCILHGTRADTGDKWSVSFGIEEAKQAGIYRQNSPWTKFPEAMCFARALSMLARQLFPDIIQGCYVEGEIRDSLKEDPIAAAKTISDEQVTLLADLIGENEEYTAKLLDFFQIESLDQLLVNQWERVLTSVQKHCERNSQEDMGIEDEYPQVMEV